MRTEVVTRLCMKSYKWSDVLKNEIPERLKSWSELDVLLLGIELKEYVSENIKEPQIFKNSAQNKQGHISILLPWEFNNFKKERFLSELQNILENLLGNISDKQIYAFENKILNDESFWKLFENGNQTDLVKSLTGKLHGKGYQFLISFEITLRHKIEKIGSNYLINLLSNELFVTDDLFLYLRLYIVLNGKKLYDLVCNEEQIEVLEIIENYSVGEMLLYLTDEVFESNFANTHHLSPREIANSIVDINSI